MKKYLISTGNGPQISISIGVTGPSIGIPIKLGKLFLYRKNDPFVRIFRNMAQDMLNVQSMGALYEKMCTSMRKHPEATYSSISVTPKFMERKSSDSGRPATLS